MQKKKKTYTFISCIFALHFVAQIVLAQKKISCGKPSDFRLIEEDQVLAGHVIASYMVRSLGECLFYCATNEGCRSINYQYTSDVSGILGLCEINSATLESCPRKAVKSLGYGYYRDNSNLLAARVYGSQKYPVRSCKDIANCHFNDGEYWIYSDKVDSPLVKVVCFAKTSKNSAKNIALNRPTTQSSTYLWKDYSNADAGNAVDGNRESDWFKYSCSHTNQSNSPWWRVDVGNVYFIRKLIITNRSDNYWGRLSNFEIRIGLSLDNNGNSNPSCGGKHSLVQRGGTKSFVCPNPMLGRYVNIILPGAGKKLTLCEVEVYG